MDPSYGEARGEPNGDNPVGEPSFQSYWACVEKLMEAKSHTVDHERAPPGFETMLTCEVQSDSSLGVFRSVLSQVNNPAVLNIGPRNPLGLARGWMVAPLLQAGVNPNGFDLDDDKKSPLHWAEGNGDVLAVRALLQGGANPMTMDSQGRTPLHAALLRNKPDISVVKHLLKADADPHMADRDRVLPIEIASNKVFEVIQKHLARKTRKSLVSEVHINSRPSSGRRSRM